MGKKAQEQEVDHETDQSQHVDDGRFWKKVTRFAQSAGRSVLEKALVLYYVSQSEHLPKHIKVMIFGALTYFISTIDAIPDITPGIGFVDDLGILVAVLGAIAAWVSPEIQSRVDAKLAEFFKSEPAQSAEKETKPQEDDQNVH